MASFFRYILVDPLVATLGFIYEGPAFHDLGVSIVMLTILVRGVLAPLFYASFKAQAKLRALQPHVKRIQEKHKDDREAQGKALMELYKEHGVNPFMSIVMLFVQLPVLIAMYNVSLYHLGAFEPSFLGLINLHERSTLMVAIAAILQYFLGISTIDRNAPANDPGAAMARNMAVIGPLITVLVLYSLPAAVGLYWITTTAYSIAQQAHVNRNYGKDTGNH